MRLPSPSGGEGIGYPPTSRVLRGPDGDIYYSENLTYTGDNDPTTEVRVGHLAADGTFSDLVYRVAVGEPFTGPFTGSSPGPITFGADGMLVCHNRLVAGHPVLRRRVRDGVRFRRRPPRSVGRPGVPGRGHGGRDDLGDRLGQIASDRPGADSGTFQDYTTSAYSLVVGPDGAVWATTDAVLFLTRIDPATGP